MTERFDLRTSLLFRPQLPTTIVSWDNYEWRPVTFPDFLQELAGLLQVLNETCFFRGHKDNDWLLDSTFSRSLKVNQGMKKTDRYSDKILQDVEFQHKFAREWLAKYNKIQLSSLLLKYKPQGLNVYYEYLLHCQHNQDNPLLKDISPPGTNFIDFSYNWKVGLFFANRDREDGVEGALYIIRQSVLGNVLFRDADSVSDKAKELEQCLVQHPGEVYDYSPLMIHPEKQLNNLLDPKPKRQEVVYMMQMDFRYDLDFLWQFHGERIGKQVFVKLILPPGTKDKIDEYLTGQGMTEDFLMPSTIFEKNQ